MLKKLLGREGGMSKSSTKPGKKILIVDDERDTIVALKILLESAGYEIEASANGRLALQKLARRPFDLLILDRMMPDIDGDQVMQVLPETLRQKMPVVILSGKDKGRDIAEGYAGGATYYITKPFTNRQVLNIVNYLIGDLTEAQRQALDLNL